MEKGGGSCNYTFVQDAGVFFVLHAHQAKFPGFSRIS